MCAPVSSCPHSVLVAHVAISWISWWVPADVGLVPWTNTLGTCTLRGNGGDALYCLHHFTLRAWRTSRSPQVWVLGVMLCLRAALDRGVHPSSSCCQLGCRSSSNLQILKRRNSCGSLMSSLTKTNGGARRTVFIRPWCFVGVKLFRGDHWFLWHFWWKAQADFTSI